MTGKLLIQYLEWIFHKTILQNIQKTTGKILAILLCTAVFENLHAKTKICVMENHLTSYLTSEMSFLESWERMFCFDYIYNNVLFVRSSM